MLKKKMLGFFAGQNNSLEYGTEKINTLVLRASNKMTVIFN